MRIFQIAALCLFSSVLTAAQQGRPNILWITSEDNGPHLGAYGDRYAITPQLDRLAAKGIRYLTAWSNAPVCAPARTTIISGLYPPSTGSQHMRSMTRLPANFKMYPQYLREAGYYCTNNQKEDYNLEKPGQVWDDSSRNAHWRNRKAGQPFFAIFNYTVSHESQIRVRPHTLRHDPKEAPIPAYHPDTPEVRHDWAQYYDKVTEMDTLAGKVLAELEADGLAEETIIFYYGDHGSGMPRSKRWPYNSGLHVPMLLHVPAKYQHLAPAGYKAGGSSDQLVSFVDLAPTVLSLAGVKPPAHMHGKAFLGPHATAPREYLFGFRGRMDERIDLVRTLRDKRYVYLRQFMPHRPYGQHVDYMFETPTTRVWHDLYLAGKLKPPQTYFWEPKPAEELYDLTQDQWEVNNLAKSPAHRSVLERFRKELARTIFEIRDVGFLPEAEIHARAGNRTPWEMGHDPKAYPLDRIYAMADLASNRNPSAVPSLEKGLRDSDSAVRYWAALGFVIRGNSAVKGREALLAKAMGDDSTFVRVAAAEALGLYGNSEQSRRALDLLVDLADTRKHGWHTALNAIGALQAMGDKAKPAKDRIAKLPMDQPGLDNRYASYVPRALEHLVATLN